MGTKVGKCKYDERLLNKAKKTTFLPGQQAL